MRNTKYGMLLAIAMLFVGYSVAAPKAAMAQDQSAQGQGGYHQGQRGNHLDMLSKQLNLSDDQKAKIKPILDDQQKQMQALRDDSSLSQDQRHEKMKQIHEASDAKINDILTPDQQKKFADLKAQRMGRQGGNKPDDSK
jgi:periplasmic protein CpxP/Spy